MPTDDGLRVCENCEFYNSKCLNEKSFFFNVVLPIDMTCNLFIRIIKKPKEDLVDA